MNPAIRSLPIHDARAKQTITQAEVNVAMKALAYRFAKKHGSLRLQVLVRELSGELTWIDQPTVEIAS